MLEKINNLSSLSKRWYMKVLFVCTFIIIISMAALMIFDEYTVQSQIIQVVNDNCVFDEPETKNEWINYYKNHPNEMKKWGILLDKDKADTALKKVNKHSYVLTKKRNDYLTKQCDENKTLIVKDSYKGIKTTYIKMKTHTGSSKKKSEISYIDRIAKAVENADHDKGIIIDLTEHAGGKYFSAMTGLSGLVEDDKPLLYILRGPDQKREPFEINYQKSVSGYSVNKIDSEYPKRIEKRKDIKVAVIIGSETSSAAEFMALALSTNRLQVRTFGSPTAAYTSSNEVIIGRNINFTTGWIQSVDGQIYKNDPISPDVDGKKTSEIKNWIYSD